MKFSLFLFLSLTLLSCQESGKDEGCNVSQTSCIFGSTHGQYEEGEMPVDAATFETNLLLDNFNASAEEKIQLAADLIKRVVASEEFRDGILNHSYNGKKTFVDNGGLTNAQIYYRLLKGAEKLSPVSNNAMDVEIELYTEASTTVGYTTPSSRRIWMNTKYFNNFNSAQVAGNLMHEWLHKLGFGHSATNNPSRPYSVPYAIGYLMSRLAKIEMN